MRTYIVVVNLKVEMKHFGMFVENVSNRLRFQRKVYLECILLLSFVVTQDPAVPCHSSLP